MKYQLKERLQEVLYKLRDSDRFIMLRALRISHFLPNSTFGSSVLDQCSLEQLVENGASFVLEQKDIEQSTVESLIAVINGLLNDSDVSTEISLLEEVPPCFDETIKKSKCAVQDENTIVESVSERSSVEAERILHKAYFRLKSSDLYNDLQNKLIGQYWDKSGVRDPFVEEMTFKQLLSIRIEYLLEKKSFTDNKVTAIVKAINKALGVVSNIGSDEEFFLKKKNIFINNQGQSRQLLEINETVKTGEVYNEELDVVYYCDEFEHPLVVSLINSYNLELSYVKNDNGGFVNFLKNLPQVINVNEYAALWIMLVYGEKKVSQLLGIDFTLEDKQKILGKILEAFKKFAITMYQNWQAALNGVVVSYENLIKEYNNKKLSLGFKNVLFMALLEALGAKEISVSEYLKYYTLNEKLFDLIIKDVKKNKKDNQKKRLHELLPSLGDEELINIYQYIYSK